MSLEYSAHSWGSSAMFAFFCCFKISLNSRHSFSFFLVGILEQNRFLYNTVFYLNGKMNMHFEVTNVHLDVFDGYRHVISQTQRSFCCFIVLLFILIDKQSKLNTLVTLLHVLFHLFQNTNRKSDKCTKTCVDETQLRSRVMSILVCLEITFPCSNTISCKSTLWKHIRTLPDMSCRSFLSKSKRRPTSTQHSCVETRPTRHDVVFVDIGVSLKIDDDTVASLFCFHSD